MQAQNTPQIKPIKEQEIEIGRYRLIVKDITPFIEISSIKEDDSVEMSEYVNVGIKARIVFTADERIIENTAIDGKSPVNIYYKDEQTAMNEVIDAINDASEYMRKKIERYKKIMRVLTKAEEMLREKYGRVKVFVNYV